MLIALVVKEFFMKKNYQKEIEQLISKKGKYLALETDKRITWCSECGNYAIQNALKRALTLENFSRRDFLYCFDIGCNGNGADKIEAYTIHGLHGRVIPLAAGAAIANPRLKVIASAGDGATFSEGVNHLVHAVRNNYPVMFIHHDNQNYGLTTGQASSTTPRGVDMNGAPDGVMLDPINVMDFVLSLRPSFLARTFSGDVHHMTEMFRLGLKHNGFAFIEVLQSCPTYNHCMPETWYLERVRDVAELKKHDPRNFCKARELIAQQEKEIYYIGLLYCDSMRPSFLDNFVLRKGAKTTLIEEVRYYDINRFLDEIG